MIEIVAAGLICSAATYLVCRLREKPQEADDEQAVRNFHRLYYRSSGTTWCNTEWLGVRTLKCPLDTRVYQEIIHESQPDVIVETGTCNGGSAYYFASILDLLGRGRVMTIDVEERSDRPSHERLEYICGGSTEPAIIDRIKQSIRPKERVMVVLDSDHSREHVLAELRAYWRLVTPGCYLVVEDTNINGKPVPVFDSGDPAAAVEEFLGENDQFIVDRSREKFLVTFNPGGWLKRLDDAADLGPR